jgi:predicted Zn finger-like uncharacterized protein
MRLTCPNCGARYEVDDGMIPPDGRDVQCSNCATTWFQPGRRPEPEPEPEETVAAEPQVTPSPTALPVETPAKPSQFEAEAEAEAGPRAPRTIDPDVRDILREEAEREARLRRGEPEPVETQSEMSLDQPSAGDDRGRRRAERETDLDAAQEGFDVAPPEVSAHAEAARRDLLPDIEEINSTLRATGDRVASEADASDIETVDTALRRRQGVRIGFGLTVMAAAVLAWVYLSSERVAGWLPVAEPVLDGYVSVIDGARFWLDDTARGLIGSDE